MAKVLLAHIPLIILVWYTGWLGHSAPIKSSFDINKYIRQNFSLSKKDLLDVAAILGQINEIALGFRLDPSDDLEKWTANSNGSSSSANGNNSAILENNDLRSKNNSASPYLFEGDILLTPSQANEILEDLISQFPDVSDRLKRSAVQSDRQVKWTVLPIKYTFDTSIEWAQRKAIEEALEFWRTHTCLWFQYDPYVKDGDYISFFRGEDDSCYSHVGKIGGKQPIAIGRHCGKLGYAAHEVAHALGMWHEQARPDSDSYVRIMWQNIKSEMSNNFLKRSWQQTETFNIPYDMGSVMHYGSYAFSYHEKYPTIQTILPGFSSTIGQREAPSFLDVKAINKLYCEGNQSRCQVQYPCANGGYLHPGFCNTCLCPDGFGGIYCEYPETSKGIACGGLVYANDDWTNISSPNYPEHYGNNQRCNWLLRAQTGHRVVLEFVDIFQLACGPTCTDYVEIKNDTTFENTGMRYCCYEKPSYLIYSQTNEMIVIFNSGYTTFNGFKARVSQYPHSRP